MKLLKEPSERWEKASVEICENLPWSSRPTVTSSLSLPSWVCFMSSFWQIWNLLLQPIRRKLLKNQGQEDGLIWPYLTKQVEVFINEMFTDVSRMVANMAHTNAKDTTQWQDGSTTTKATTEIHDRNTFKKSFNVKLLKGNSFLLWFTFVVSLSLFYGFCHAVTFVVMFQLLSSCCGFFAVLCWLLSCCGFGIVLWNLLWSCNFVAFVIILWLFLLCCNFCSCALASVVILWLLSSCCGSCRCSFCNCVVFCIHVSRADYYNHKWTTLKPQKTHK